MSSLCDQCVLTFLAESGFLQIFKMPCIRNKLKHTLPRNLGKYLWNIPAASFWAPHPDNCVGLLWSLASKLSPRCLQEGLQWEAGLSLTVASICTLTHSLSERVLQMHHPLPSCGWSYGSANVFWPCPWPE